MLLQYSKSHVKISRSNRFTSSAVSPDASHQRYAPQKLDSPPALDLPQQHTEGLAVSAYLAGSARNRVRGVAPRAAVADAIVADDMMLKSYKGRRIPQPEFECAENEPRAVIIRRQVEVRTEWTRRFLAATREATLGPESTQIRV